MKKQNYRKIIPYFILTILVLGIILLSLKINKIFPFGTNEISNLDAILEYKPILYDFITSIKNGSLTSFSFSSGLGNPTFFNYFYYLASPITFVALPFHNPNAMLNSIIITKTILSALTSLFYFRKRSENSFVAFLCALAYTFSGWYLAYNFHFMWLDAFLLFPILQYSLEQLTYQNKYHLYIFSLAYAILSTFHLSLILIIYSIIYYIYNMIIKKEEYKAKLKNVSIMFFSTMVAFLLSSVAIYTAYCVLIRTGINITQTLEEKNPNILLFLATLFTGNFSLNYSGQNIPNLSLSLLFLISFIYYFLNNKISKKERVGTFIIIILISLFLLSTNVNNFLNNFHNITNYSYRYSFIITFYFIFIFIRNYQTNDGMIDKKIYIASLLILIALLVTFYNKVLGEKIFLFNLIFLILYTGCIAISKNKKVVSLALTMILIVECFFNYQLVFQNKSEIKSLTTVSKTSEGYRNLPNQDVSIYNSLSQNLYSNTDAIETYSRIQYKDLIYFLNNLGCQTDTKTTVYNCVNTKVFNMLFNVDNTYKLPKIYAINKEIDLYNLDTENFIENQNNLVLGMANIPDIIEAERIQPIVSNNQKAKQVSTKDTNKETPEKKELPNTFTYHLETDKEYILEYTTNMLYIKVGDIIYTPSKQFVPENYQQLTINDELYFKRMLIIDASQNKKIEVAYYNSFENTDLNLFYVNQDKLENFYNFIKTGAILLEQYQDNVIEGTINVSDSELIFTSIPYDPSWHVYIDDIRVETRRINDVLLGIECEPGSHKIRLEYKNNYSIPMIISLTTLLGLVIDLAIKRKKSL